MKKILFCGGGSAGHVTPNIALIERLIGSCRIHYLGVGGMERRLIQPFIERGVVYSEYSGVRFERKVSVELCLLPFKLKRAVESCKAALKLIRPDLVVSKGGYGGLPVVIAAHKLKIPAVAHESDYSLGLANRLSLPYVEKMFTVFENAASQAGKKGVKCAPPLRDNIFGNAKNALRVCNFASNKPVLLILGGSLGSETINNAISKSLDELRGIFNVIAVTGRNKAIAAEGEGFYQLDFTDRIGDLYACATVAVARAGSNTISELAANGIPSVLIPLCRGSRGEQIKNAEVYGASGCCEVLTERELTQQSLKDAVMSVYGNREKMKENILHYASRDTVMLDYIKARMV